MPVGRPPHLVEERKDGGSASLAERGNCSQYNQQLGSEVEINEQQESGDWNGTTIKKFGKNFALTHRLIRVVH